MRHGISGTNRQLRRYGFQFGTIHIKYLGQLLNTRSEETRHITHRMAKMICDINAVDSHLYIHGQLEMRIVSRLLPTFNGVLVTGEEKTAVVNFRRCHMHILLIHLPSHER